MICPNCQKEINEGSRFCVYCGAKLPEESASVIKEPTTDETANEEREKTEAKEKSEEALCKACGKTFLSSHIFCPYCGTRKETEESLYDAPAEEQEPIEEEAQQKPSFFEYIKKNLVLSIVSAVSVTIAIVLVIVCIVLGAKANNADRLNDSLIRENAMLSDTVEEYSETITALNDQIDSLNYQLASGADSEQELYAKLNEINVQLDEKTDEYNKLIEYLSDSSLGYGSENFYTDRAVIVMNENSFASFTLYTLNDVNESSITTRLAQGDASLVFESSSWDNSVNIKVRAGEKGLSVFTMSNDVDNTTMSVLIIVR